MTMTRQRLIIHYLITAQYDMAYKFLFTCSQDITWNCLADDLEQLLTEICSVQGLVQDNGTGEFFNNTKIHDLLGKIIERIPDSIENKYQLEFLYAKLLFRWSRNANLLKAFDVLSGIKGAVDRARGEILVELAELCSESCLNYPKEQESFASQALATFDKNNFILKKK